MDNTPNEEWREIEGHNGMYEVSNLGRVRTWHNNKWGKLSKPRIKKLVNINRKVKYLGTDLGGNLNLAHRLVAKAFIPNPNNYHCVCHKDDDGTNNKVENLYWGSYAMNNADCKNKGRNAKGEKVWNSKFTDEQVREIKKELQLTYRGIQKDLAMKYNTNPTNISRILRETRWKHIKI